MNKVILMGRLTKDPETRYSQSAEPLAVTKYTLAISRRFKRKGEAEADFINCVAFGKSGEFAEKYFKKGQMISVVGRIQIRLWEDQSGTKHWATDVIVEEQYFTGSKAEAEQQVAPQSNSKPTAESQDGFYPVDDDEEDLPF